MTTETKTTYIVSYQRDEFDPFCTNLAVAVNEEDVRVRYETRFEGIRCLSIREAKDHEIEPLKRRGCPVVECEHVESAPAVTFNTVDEYEAQCNRMRDYGIDIAGDQVWKACKEDMERSWEAEDSLRHSERADGACSAELEKRIRQHNIKARRRLEGYQGALRALGIELSWSYSRVEHKHIHKVTAIRRGYVVGCIASW